MKKKYSTPNTLVVKIATAASTMITGSGVSEEKLGSGVSALSRDGGSFWDDEDEY